eukprot:CAMPEP_0198129222 /NCGR_PEP_ID=MMETSP1442-20131203/51214_1 /TAXON_ID= /ORGANISM="Craspedostauros australis, Strain CCMP3328" /LENGTH=77 /DNA_ID=CAMNT_0043789577 /DNA_START=526 /DNA_END=759 /DNA_ORIENTATION=-
MCELASWRLRRATLLECQRHKYIVADLPAIVQKPADVATAAWRTVSPSAARLACLSQKRVIHVEISMNCLVSRQLAR